METFCWSSYIVTIWCNKGSFKGENKTKKIKEREKEEEERQEGTGERTKEAGSEIKEDMEAWKFPRSEKLLIPETVLFF